MSQTINLQAIKTAAKSQYGQIPGVQGFGIGDGTLSIYVQNAALRNQLPAEFQGVPIEFVVTGDIKAYSIPATTPE